MATNPSADGIRIEPVRLLKKIFRLLCRLLSHCQKAACTFTEAPIDSEHDDYPAESGFVL